MASGGIGNGEVVSAMRWKVRRRDAYDQFGDVTTTWKVVRRKKLLWFHYIETHGKVHCTSCGSYTASLIFLTEQDAEAMVAKLNSGRGLIRWCGHED